VRLSSGRSFRTWILVVACVRRIDIHSNTQHLCRSKEHETSFFFRGAARLKCPRFPGYARDLSVRDARYKFKKKKRMFYASPFALSMKPKNSIHKTQILVRVFIGTFSFWPFFFFFGFLASRIHLLGRGDEKKTKQREKKTNMSFYIRP
jgi:hypothetical protein